MIIPQLSICIATILMEEEIADVNVRLNQAMHEIVIFQNIIRRNFEFPETWVATSRLDHCLLA